MCYPDRKYQTNMLYVVHYPETSCLNPSIKFQPRFGVGINPIPQKVTHYISRAKQNISLTNKWLVETTDHCFWPL